MSKTTTVLTVAGLGLLAYVVYFDYKRRNDAAFRKKLRKEKKKVDKTVAQTAAADSDGLSTAFPQGLTDADIRAAMDKVKSEEVPPSPEEKETYFMTQVGMGEQLCAQGPNFYLPAAMCFYRALRVYPTPVELIIIYQTTVPEPVFKIVMEMTQLDVKERVEGYYDHFPEKSMNVSVKPIDVPTSDGKVLRRRALVVNKDFSAGEVIYKEQPVIAALDADLEGKGTHCSHCLRQINKGMAIRPDSDLLNSVYCSKECQVNSKAQSQNLLFGSEPAVPPELRSEASGGSEIAHKAAQEKFLEFIKTDPKLAPLLVARFVARNVSAELAKLTPRSAGSPKQHDGLEYTLFDHVERLRYLEIEAANEGWAPLQAVLETAMPGLSEFLTDERFATLLGKMAYNAFGVTFGGGRDDKPLSIERPEDIERTRTPYGTSKQVGAGLYTVSSYTGHSCEPSARPSFSGGTAELHLIANRDLKAGDELTVAFVDVSKHDDESVVEGRRRRRMELARGWRFACTCARCEAEAPSEGDSTPVQKDESKVEDSVKHLEERESQAQAAQID